MALKVFLSPDIANDAVDFKRSTRVRVEHGTKEDVEVLKFFGITIFRETEGYSFHFSDAYDQLSLPAGMESKVLAYSVQESFPVEPRRARGIYRHPDDETVMATVTRGCSHEFSCRHSDLKKVQELRRMVLAGTLAPFESWDGPQVASERRSPQSGGESLILLRAIQSLDSDIKEMTAMLDELLRVEAQRARSWGERLEDGKRSVVREVRRVTTQISKKIEDRFTPGFFRTFL